VLDGMGTSIIGLAQDEAESNRIITELRAQLAGELSTEQDQLFVNLLTKSREKAQALVDLDAKNPATGGGAGQPSPDIPPVPEEPAPAEQVNG
jgi:hypothetical protein